jgi:hypothetical protein
LDAPQWVAGETLPDQARPRLTRRARLRVAVTPRTAGAADGPMPAAHLPRRGLPPAVARQLGRIAATPPALRARIARNQGLALPPRAPAIKAARRRHASYRNRRCRRAVKDQLSSGPLSPGPGPFPRRRAAMLCRDVDDLRLGVFLEPLLAQCRPQAGLLGPAERHVGRQVQMLVDPNRAGVDPQCDLVRAFDVGRPVVARTRDDTRRRSSLRPS